MRDSHRDVYKLSSACCLLLAKVPKRSVHKLHNEEAGSLADVVWGKSLVTLLFHIVRTTFVASHSLLASFSHFITSLTFASTQSTQSGHSQSSNSSLPKRVPTSIDLEAHHQTSLILH